MTLSATATDMVVNSGALSVGDKSFVKAPAVVAKEARLVTQPRVLVDVTEKGPTPLTEAGIDEAIVVSPRRGRTRLIVLLLPVRSVAVALTRGGERVVREGRSPFSFLVTLES